MLARPSSNRDGNTLGNIGGWFESVLSFFGKSGPWAVLSLLMIFGIAYELHVVIGTVGTHVTEYVTTSGRSLDSLLDAQQKATEQHVALQASSEQLSIVLADNSRQVIINGEHINQLQKLMQDAYAMMKDSAVVREQMTLEQTELLKRLEAGINELNQLTLEGQAMAAANNEKTGAQNGG